MISIIVSQEMKQSSASLTFITGSCTHGVEEDWLGDVGTVDLAVGVGHALVQSLQGEVGGVIWLLQKHVACEGIIEYRQLGLIGSYKR